MTRGDALTTARLDRFRLGVNYWPARTAMQWWSRFDRVEVASDFARIAESGLDSVRVFLTWEDFQPAPDVVDREMVSRLVQVADLAGETGLDLIPTLFTGHMSGVNWVPEWALGGTDGDDRFRVVSNGKVSKSGLRNWYSDAAVMDAQCFLAGEVVTALRAHGAVGAWDLGNENSNCVIPPSEELGRMWLSRLVSAIREADAGALVTVGLHMEDLEEDRRLGPREAAVSCDFLSMHGYPIYASWADGSTDEQVLPFLARVTRWLGDGHDVAFTELGLPTYRRDEVPAGTRIRDPRLVDEDAAASFTTAALEALQRAGCVGAMLWCYSDYDTALWSSPPLDTAPHERSFGLWRADGSAKPAVAAVTAFAGATRIRADNDPWLDLDRDEFLLDPGRHLPRLYRRFLTLGRNGEDRVEQRAES